MRPLSRLTFSSVELLSALPSEPVAIANRLSAPARPATLTLGALLLPRLPSVGSPARGDVLLAVGVETAMPNALAVGVCAHAWAVGIAALNRRPRTRNPQAPPVVVASLFMVQSSLVFQAPSELIAPEGALQVGWVVLPVAARHRADVLRVYRGRTRTLQRVPVLRLPGA